MKPNAAFRKTQKIWRRRADAVGAEGVEGDEKNVRVLRLSCARGERNQQESEAPSHSAYCASRWEKAL